MYPTISTMATPTRDQNSKARRSRLFRLPALKDVLNTDRNLVLGTTKKSPPATCAISTFNVTVGPCEAGPAGAAIVEENNCPMPTSNHIPFPTTKTTTTNNDDPAISQTDPFSDTNTHCPPIRTLRRTKRSFHFPNTSVHVEHRAQSSSKPPRKRHRTTVAKNPRNAFRHHSLLSPAAASAGATLSLAPPRSRLSSFSVSKPTCSATEKTDPRAVALIRRGLVYAISEAWLHSVRRVEIGEKGTDDDGDRHDSALELLSLDVDLARRLGRYLAEKGFHDANAYPFTGPVDDEFLSPTPGRRPKLDVALRPRLRTPTLPQLVAVLTLRHNDRMTTRTRSRGVVSKTGRDRRRVRSPLAMYSIVPV